MAEVPDELIKLERSAEEERAKLARLRGDEYDAQWRRWRKATEDVQAAVTAHAAATQVNRYELEQDVKRAVRHAEEGPRPSSSRGV
ncbi:hypothetical protein KBP30_41140 [Streptomyces sp. Go40/10]|uniref:hypothetical protein n=1 Tax=Streptomyces sp. Go40/10 TaxID=2825844 RepID=UPI001E544BD9|nr:hypothetical protein [Streptomyces sp. Go40/10]UFR07148.1 hypothetical protein KBP30_41140 [Streptomyces sp. Go40/10]